MLWVSSRVLGHTGRRALSRNVEVNENSLKRTRIKLKGVTGLTSGHSPDRSPLLEGLWTGDLFRELSTHRFPFLAGCTVMIGSSQTPHHVGLD